MIDSMWLELRKVFDSLSIDSSIRSIVLSGAGDKAFTSGLDVQYAFNSSVLSFSTEDGARRATGLRRHIAEFQDCITSVEKCEKPVICVLHGYSMGLAIDLSSCADVRICASDTKFAVKEVDIGLAADIGTLSRLPKIVGSYSWVKDVAMSARIFGAQEAEKVGFVSAVYESKQETVNAALKWAKLVAEKSPVAVQGTKNILDYSRDHPVADG
jgi:Delta3,5-Delta2,4-dienoyl-CoA isomerase